MLSAAIRIGIAALLLVSAFLSPRTSQAMLASTRARPEVQLYQSTSTEPGPDAPEIADCFRKPRLGISNYFVEVASGSCLFLQRDPFGYEDSVNLYAGLANDPVNVRDPTGAQVEGEEEEDTAGEVEPEVVHLYRTNLELRRVELLTRLPTTEQAEADPPTVRASRRQPIEELEAEVRFLETEVVRSEFLRLSEAEQEALSGSPQHLIALSTPRPPARICQFDPAVRGPQLEFVFPATPIAGRQATLADRQVSAAEALQPLRAAFPAARVGFRGSLARGTKGQHKKGAPFDPENFDVDAFVVSNELAARVPQNAQGFRNLARIPDHRRLVSEVAGRVKGIEGCRATDTFKVRVFSEKEFKSIVKANERFLLP